MEIKNFFRKNLINILLFPLIFLAVYLPVVVTPYYCADLEYVQGAKGSIYNWLELGRYSLILIKKISFTPYNIVLEGILFITAASALIFPTFVEQFYFKFQSFEVLFGVFLLAVSAVFFVEFTRKGKAWRFLVSVLLNVASFGIYQSMLNIMLVLYAGIFLMLFLDDIEYEKFRVFFFMALQFLVSFLINAIISKICGSGSYFSDKIMWKQYPFDTCYHFVKHYIRVVLLAESPLYTFSFALALLLALAAFVFLLIKTKGKAMPSIIGIIGLAVLPFVIAIIQGFEPDSRTQLALPFSIAFLFYFAYGVCKSYLIQHKGKKIANEFWAGLAIILSAVLLLLNIVPSYRLSYSRYVINKFDKKHLSAIAEDLKNFNCDVNEYGSKPIYFIGNLPYEDTPFCYEYDKTRKDYVLISVFALDSDIIPTYFYSSNRILSAMDILGYHYKKPNTSRYLHVSKNTAIGMPAYPEEGYIEETDNYIVVNLGNYVSPFKK